jgi:hypothetical protein
LKSSVPLEWLKRRKLMNLAYAKQEVDPTMLASLDGGGKASAGDASAAQAIASAPKVDAGDGKTKVAIVEPKKGDEVAEDPQFAKATAETKVSSNVTMGGAKRPPAQKIDKVEPKQLTKARPYKLDGFVSDRVKEIKALENIMSDEEKYFESKGKKKKSKDEGNGLW